MRTLEKQLLGWFMQPMAVYKELERRRFSENAAHIRALEPLKPLVSLVRWQAHARIPREKMANFRIALQCRKCRISSFRENPHKYFHLRCPLSLTLPAVT